MKAMLFGVASIMLVGATATPQRGPYSIQNGQLVSVDLSGQTTSVVAAGEHPLSGIELSRDGSFYGVNLTLDRLERIDAATGEWFTVGPLGLGPGVWTVDMDEDADGQLWLLTTSADPSRLYTVDRTTGAASLYCEANTPYLAGLASLGGTRWTTAIDDGPPDPGCGLEYLPLSLTPYRTQLDSGSDGWIYGLSGAAHPSLEATQYFFFRARPGTGNLEWLWHLVTNASNDIDGFTLDATQQPLPSAVPGLGPLGAAMAVLLVIAAGLWLLQRWS